MKTLQEEQHIIHESKETFRHIAELLRTQDLTPRTRKKVEDFVALMMIQLSTDMDVVITEFSERRIVKIPKGKLSYLKEYPHRLLRVSIEKEVRT